MHLRRTLAAIVAALAIALTGASGVFATDQSVPVTEQVEVQAYTTLTVTPTSLYFGSDLGDTDRTADSDLAIEWASNNAHGITVALAADDFVSVDSNVIAKSNETVTDGFTTSAADGRVLTDTSAATADSTILTVYLHVPAIAPSGVYTSTLTVSATEKS